MLTTDVSATLIIVSQALFILAAVIFAISAIDDIFIDIYFFIKKAFNSRVSKNKNKDAPDLQALLNKPQRHLALMLPAWSEADIIFSAVSNIIKTIEYDKYQIFIGTYPNDEETQTAVDELTRRYSNIHKVVTSLPGPTCKADCLNHIISNIHDYENRHNIEFSGVIMQDAEDVVHPLCMKLFNYMLFDFDLVQFPVFSLKRHWTDLTGGHYMDEFAEFHSKEFFVRESLANIVPGAGVGTAYSQKALEFAAETGEYFSTKSLTEDYEFSFRLRDAGLKQTFVKFPINKKDDIWKKDGADPTDKTGGYIATREFFPNKFWPSVRQKTRWTIGISFQAWKSFGWKGDWSTKYLFWRDRKMIFFSHAIAIGFISILILSVFGVKGWVESDAYSYATILEADSYIWYIAYFNIFMLVLRLVQRHYWSYRYYSWSSLPMVIPRYIWGAIINYFAICRATMIFTKHLFNGQTIGWDKTSHDFPEFHAANDHNSRLGELLVERELLTQSELDFALSEQLKNDALLGRIVIDCGFVSDEELVSALGDKFHLQSRAIDPFTIEESLYRILPYELVREHQIIPIGWDANKRLEIASCQILSNALIDEIEAIIKTPVVIYLATMTDIYFSLHTFFHLAKGKDNQCQTRSAIYSLTDRIKKKNETISANRTKKLRAAHIPFGQHLLKSNLLSHNQLDKFVIESGKTGIHLGQYLVEQGVINSEQCEEIVYEIENNYKAILENYEKELAA